jgi:hypothetical protein
VLKLKAPPALRDTALPHAQLGPQQARMTVLEFPQAVSYESHASRS